MSNSNFLNQYRAWSRRAGASLAAAVALSTTIGCVGAEDDLFEADPAATVDPARPTTGPAAISDLEVIDSVLEGQSIRFYLAEPAPSDLADRVRGSVDWFTLGETDLERGSREATVRVEDDGYSIVLALAEALPADATVHGLLRLVDADDTIDLGTLDTPGEFQAVRAPVAAAFDGPIIVVPWQPFQVTGTSVSGQNSLARDTRKVTVRFNRQLDCRRTPKAPFTVSVYTTESSSDFQQLMYHDPAHVNPSDPKYRGQFECFAGTAQSGGRLEFLLPGPLLGDADVRLRVRDVVSVNGETVDKTFINFRTERPGIRAQLKRMKHNYDKRCDRNRVADANEYKENCDVYMAVASYRIDRNAKPTGTKVPASGTFSNFAKGTTRSMNHTVFESYSPVPKAIGFDFAIMDSDDDNAADKAKKIIEVVTRVVGEILAEFGYDYAVAIANGANEITAAIIDVASDGDDDFLGSRHLSLDRGDDRWGTQRNWLQEPVSVFRNNGEKMNLYIQFEEWPASWKL